MAEDSTGSITQFLQQVQRGDAAGARDLWLRFFPRMLGLAAKTLAGRPQRMADADDAVQSALASFFQRTSAGEFAALHNREELWKLLGVITVRKSLKQSRREQAAKRGGGATIDEAALGDGVSGRRSLEELAAQLPTQEFDLRCEELLEMLGEELRPYAILRLLGYRNREIAEQFDCTERKVERKLQLVRLQWEQELAE